MFPEFLEYTSLYPFIHSNLHFFYTVQYKSPSGVMGRSNCSKRSILPRVCDRSTPRPRARRVTAVVIGTQTDSRWRKSWRISARWGGLERRLQSKRLGRSQCKAAPPPSESNAVDPILHIVRLAVSPASCATIASWGVDVGCHPLRTMLVQGYHGRGGGIIIVWYVGVVVHRVGRLLAFAPSAQPSFWHR